MTMPAYREELIGALREYGFINISLRWGPASLPATQPASEAFRAHMFDWVAKVEHPAITAHLKMAPAGAPPILLTLKIWQARAGSFCVSGFGETRPTVEMQTPLFPVLARTSAITSETLLEVPGSTLDEVLAHITKPYTVTAVKVHLRKLDL
jgi:hypothetical protein